MTWVVAYDVSQDGCRARVARMLMTRGIRVQKSVFVLECTATCMRSLVDGLAALIDPATDCVHAWPLIDAWRQRSLCVPTAAALVQETFVVA